MNAVVLDIILKYPVAAAEYYYSSDNNCITEIMIYFLTFEYVFHTSSPSYCVLRTRFSCFEFSAFYATGKIGTQYALLAYTPYTPIPGTIGAVCAHPSYGQFSI